MRPKGSSSLICVNAVFRLKFGILGVHVAATSDSSSSLFRRTLQGATVNGPVFRIAVLFQINSSLIA